MGAVTRRTSFIFTAFACAVLFLGPARPSPVDLKNAEMIRTFSGGIKEYRLRDDSRLFRWPDGRFRWELKDGTVVYFWPENVKNSREGGEFPQRGTRKTALSNGNTIWEFPDGSVREEKTDGSVWESVPVRRDIVDPEVVKMSPWPRSVKPGDRVVLSGSLKGGFEKPWAAIAKPDGNLVKFESDDFRFDSPRFSLPVIMDSGKGRYRVEIIAQGPSGNRVAMNVSIWAGQEPPSNEGPELYKTVNPTEPLHHLEGDFYRLINRARAEKGVSPVEWDAEAGQLARHMSRELAREGRLRHVSPKWGDLAARAVRVFGWNKVTHGLPQFPPGKGGPNYIADALVKSRSLNGAMAVLMESPAHRLVLMHPHWTHAGVGISRIEGGDGRDIIVTVAMLRLNRPKRARNAEREK